MFAILRTLGLALLCNLGLTATVSIAAPLETSLHQSLQQLRQQLTDMQANLDVGQDRDVERSAMRTLRLQMAQLERGVERRLQQLQRHLEHHRLPAEILARHSAARSHIQARQVELRQSLDALEAATEPSRQRLRIRDLLEKLASNQPRLSDLYEDEPAEDLAEEERTPATMLQPSVSMVATAAARTPPAVMECSPPRHRGVFPSSMIAPMCARSVSASMCGGPATVTSAAVARLGRHVSALKYSS